MIKIKSSKSMPPKDIDCQETGTETPTPKRPKWTRGFGPLLVAVDVCYKVVRLLHEFGVI